MSAPVTHGITPHNMISQSYRARVYRTDEYRSLADVSAPTEKKQEEEADSNNTAVADMLLERASASVTVVSSVVGECHTPTPFLVFLVKMLHLNLCRETIVRWLRPSSPKYVRVLAAFYVRLTFPPCDVWHSLEPLLDDFRRVVVRDPSGVYRGSHVDEVVDGLLHETKLLDLSLPNMPIGRAEMERRYPRQMQLVVSAAPKSVFDGDSDRPKRVKT